MSERSPALHPLERLPAEWRTWVEGEGQPVFRAAQIYRWLHREGVLDPERMTNLPKALRVRLQAEWGEAVTVSRVSPSADGTKKLLVRLADGREVETVLLPRLAPDGEEDDDTTTTSVTQCVSTQVGCAMGCVFCASGVAGLVRHLSAAEILAQLHVARQHLLPGQALRNVVFMGMGEPLHNYDAVARSIRLMTDPDGLGLSTRRVTLSTSGLVPQIDRLAADFGGQVQLAISLHAVDDERRSRIMPINRKHDLHSLLACLRRYPLPPRRRITIEYTLLHGVNDGVEDADRLAALLRGVPVKVNLIPMNPIEGSELGAPSWEAVLAFQERLRTRNVSTFVRRQRGDEVAAACGQLALHGPGRRRSSRGLRVVS